MIKTQIKIKGKEIIIQSRIKEKKIMNIIRNTFMAEISDCLIK